jgi:hypothetical protein
VGTSARPSMLGGDLLGEKEMQGAEIGIAMIR